MAMERKDNFRFVLAAILALALLWEVAGRPLMEMLFPDLRLPASMLTEIAGLLARVCVGL